MLRSTKAKPKRSVLLKYRGEVIVPLRLEQIEVANRAGADDLRHFALDNAAPAAASPIWSQIAARFPALISFAM